MKTTATTDVDHQAADRPRARRLAAAAVLALALGAGGAGAEPSTRAGTLTCLGEGGWGAVVTSRKEFDCTYNSVDGNVREGYRATIRKVGLDIGRTDKSALAWVVLGSQTRLGGDYVPGSLAGSYRGVGAEATVGTGVGANVLFREGDDAFALQPVSLQMQTGLALAVGVQTLTLEFTGIVVE
jgi:hypothetical protein